jgi:ribonuclease-3
MARRTDYKELQHRIGYHFKNIDLLKNAFMHTSYVNEQGMDKTKSNQRMEYLGDAVVELSITDVIFERLPDADEGRLSSLRAKLVCTSGLARAAAEMRLGEYLILGNGAEKGNERTNPTVLEDAFEALVGAVYLDGGWKKAKNFVFHALQVSILNAIEGIGRASYSWDRKTALQIELQKKGSVKISYKLVKEEGPPHERVFTVNVFADGKLLGSGVGCSKKEAEQGAAGHALEEMNVLKEG